MKKDDEKEIVELKEIKDERERVKLNSEKDDHDLKSDESFKTFLKYVAIGVGLLVFATVFPHVAMYAAIAGAASVAYSAIKYAESKSEHNKFNEIEKKLNYKDPKPAKTEEKGKEIEKEEKIEKKIEKKEEKGKGNVLNPGKKIEKSTATDMKKARLQREKIAQITEQEIKKERKVHAAVEKEKRQKTEGTEKTRN